MNITQEQYDADIRAAKAEALREQADSLSRALNGGTPGYEYGPGVRWAIAKLHDQSRRLDAR